MRVFVTGATGFIGTKLVKELVDVGHTVRGLSRSDEGMEQLKAMGAEAQRGDLEDLDGLRRGVAGMDAVVEPGVQPRSLEVRGGRAQRDQGDRGPGSCLGAGKGLRGDFRGCDHAGR